LGITKKVESFEDETPKARWFQLIKKRTVRDIGPAMGSFKIQGTLRTTASRLVIVKQKDTGTNITYDQDFNLILKPKM